MTWTDGRLTKDFVFVSATGTTNPDALFDARQADLKAFGRIETPGGIEKSQKTLLGDVLRGGRGIGQAVCSSKNHLSMPLKQQQECGLASAHQSE